MLRSDICFASDIALRAVKKANIIPLKPLVFNNTFALRKYHSDTVGISLIISKNLSN